MKKTICFSVCFVLIAVCILAQTPQAFKYQAVARDNAGNVLLIQNVSFRMTILQGDLPGTAVYSETHQVTTNEMGLVTIEVGRGTPVSGSFETINWRVTPCFMKTEIDPQGGTAYIEMGTSEILSVPYALHSGSSSSGWSVNGNSGTNPDVNFIGTTDNTALKFKVNNQQAGWLDPAENANTGFGYQSLSGNTTGILNTAFGYQALLMNDGGFRNTATGYVSMYSNTSGHRNAAYGYASLFSNTTGEGNIAIGHSALFNSNGNNNTAIGRYALISNTAGNSNVALGASSLYNNTNAIIIKQGISHSKNNRFHIQ